MRRSMSKWNWKRFLPGHKNVATTSGYISESTNSMGKPLLKGNSDANIIRSSKMNETPKDWEGMDSQEYDLLTVNPTKAWETFKHTNKVENVKPMALDTPIAPDMVRFVCVSDTHSQIHRMNHSIPMGDVFIHAGDFTNTGELKEVREFNDFLGKLPHPHKIVIAGNHELSFDIKTANSHHYARSPEVKPGEARALITNCTFLEDSAVQIYGLNIYGSPWQPWFGGWAYNLKRGKDCLEKWDLILSDTDILVTHGPPIGYGDLCKHGDRAGCVNLLRTIRDRVQPKFHICGHIHEGIPELSRSIARPEVCVVLNDQSLLSGYGITTNGVTTFINASICTLSYIPSNPPVIFDVPLPTGQIKSLTS